MAGELMAQIDCRSAVIFDLGSSGRGACHGVAHADLLSALAGEGWPSPAAPQQGLHDPVPHDTWVPMQQEESELESVMKAADLDGDGTLNYEEFICATANLAKLEKARRETLENPTSENPGE